MNLNSLADAVQSYLATKHARVYRNRAPVSPTFPYVVYRIDSVADTYPSEDLYINVDIFDAPLVSVRTIEDLADLIDNDLNHSVILTMGLNAHFEREQRQYVPTSELVEAQMVNLRYVARTYF